MGRGNDRLGKMGNGKWHSVYAQNASRIVVVGILGALETSSLYGKAHHMVNLVILCHRHVLY